MEPSRILVVLLMSCSLAAAQELPLKIDLSGPTSRPVFGNIKMGGADPAGVEIGVNSRYLMRANMPWLPVMGEMHYSRYPREEWEREILKMKAGGINVVSAYIFWIHHEEIEGQFDWSDNRDLGEFVRLCGKHGLLVWLRLGPWDHGEVRNGGLPDWLVAKFPNRKELRSTNPAFMAETRKLYEQIYKQVAGLLYKDGGPIIGIQVENEMRNNPAYLLALKNMAKEVGFNVPLYSMTGWGPAQVPQGELLPMFGGYGDGFWITDKAGMGQGRVQYFFTHNPNDEKIRMTSRPAELPASMAYLSQYPYLTCEIGGGMAIAYARRPQMEWKDVTAIALNKLGDGSNSMGYYMYHGGANPIGKLSTLQELESTAMTNDNDLPVVHYDFQAPLGEFGQVRPSYHALRMLHMFVADFGRDLCTMPSKLPAVLPTSLDDSDTLRWAIRSDGTRGFIFIDNHERGATLPPKDVQFALHLAAGDMTVPREPVKIPADALAIWPFNLDMNGVKLRYATAQLLCKLDGAQPAYVFFAPDGIEPTFAVEKATMTAYNGQADMQVEPDGVNVFSKAPFGLDNPFAIHAPGGKSVRIVVLTQEQAMQCWKVHAWGADRLVFSTQSLSWDDTSLLVQSDEPATDIRVFPFPNQSVSLPGRQVIGPMQYATYQLKSPEKIIQLTVEQTQTAGPARKVPMSNKPKPLPLPPTDADFEAAAVWHIKVPADALDEVADVRLKIDYVGDAARAYVGDRLIDDDYYFGKPWEIGLRRFGPEILSNGITLKILPLAADNPALLDPQAIPAAAGGGFWLELKGVTPEVVYESTISAK